MSLLRIFLGFVVCCGISAVGLYIALLASLKDVNLLSGGGRPRNIVEIAVILVGIALPIVIFPLAAYFLREDFRQLKLSWLPPSTLSILFGLFPVILPVILFISSVTSMLISIWHPCNGEQRKYDNGRLVTIRNWKNGKTDGNLIHYCPDGRINYNGNYVDGLRVGEEIIQECDSTNLKEMKFYDNNSKLVWRKKFYNDVLSEEFIVDSDKETFRNFTNEGKISLELVTEYEIDTNGLKKTIRTIRKSYDSKTGKYTEEIL